MEQRTGLGTWEKRRVADTWNKTDRHQSTEETADNLTEGTSCALQIKLFKVEGLGQELPCSGQCPEVYA